MTGIETIEDAPYGTLKWFHEDRHRWQNRRYKTGPMIARGRIGLTLAMLFWTVGQFSNAPSLSSSVFGVFVFIAAAYLSAITAATELDAILYAKMKINEAGARWKR